MELTPTQWIKKIKRNYEGLNIPFDAESFNKSCIIHSKGGYGIFLLESYDGKRYTVKVTVNSGITDEISVGLYIKEFASHIPNLLHVEALYIGNNPSSYSLFTKKLLNEVTCKKEDISKVFREKEYYYYLTKACSYSLSYYLGGNVKGEFTFEAFVGFSFSLLVALQTLHRLGIWHHDIAGRNVLVCNSDIAQKYSNIRYVYNDGTINKSWTISYKVLGNRDMKLIDYGEAKISDNITNHCLNFGSEVSVSLFNLLKLMWNKVVKKTQDQEIQYIELKTLLEGCTTTILDPMLNAKIYNSISDISSDNTYNVNLLPF